MTHFHAGSDETDGMMHGSFLATGPDAKCVVQSGFTSTRFLVDEAAEGVLVIVVRTTDVGPPECRARVEIRV